MLQRGRRTVGSGRWPRWVELERYGHDLTARLAEHPALLVVRPEVNRRLAAALLRSSAANAAVIGAAGIGKRSAVHALAQALVGDAPPPGLEGRQVYWLDARRLVAGTRFRGDLETRVGRLAAEVTAGRGRLIVALDHAELLVDAEPGAHPEVAVSELLQPGGWLLPLTDSAWAEFGDAAGVNRLLQVIEMPVWPDEVAEEAVRGRLVGLAAHHDVSFPEEAAQLAVRLAGRYVGDQAVPGAAVDLIDAASARVRSLGARTVDREALLAAVAERTGLPLAALGATGPGATDTRWHDVEGSLGARVVGQPKAVHAMAAALRRARAGIGDARRPLGCFLFLGPTGVGKTELARAVAEFLFGDEETLVRIDMSEYLERHAIARLIGAPPGYVGFELPGQLTDPVRRRPFSVVLLDEVEKAHPDVLNLLLQLLEDGRLTDGYGRTVDFRHTVVVLTSNAGSTETDTPGSSTSGEAQVRGVLLAAARKLLRPELFNRLDSVVMFDRLAERDMERIVELQLSRASARLEPWGLTLHLSAPARRALAEEGYDPELGARPVRRLIDSRILDPIAAALLAGGTGSGVVDGVCVRRRTDPRRPAADTGDVETAG